MNETDCHPQVKSQVAVVTKIAESVSFQLSVCPISEFAPMFSRFQSVLECFTWQ